VRYVESEVAVCLGARTCQVLCSDGSKEDKEDKIVEGFKGVRSEL
jgi:hypothetical protein